MDNIFWKNDISILYKNSNYKNFLPRSECNLNENLNRFTRLSFYYFFIFSILFFIYQGHILYSFQFFNLQFSLEFCKGGNNPSVTYKTFDLHH